MKKIIVQYKIALLALVVAITATSCKKEFLEVLPKGKLIASKTSDYHSLFNSVTSLAPRELTLYMADDVCGLLPAYSGNNNLEKRLFTFEADLFEDDENPSMLVPWLNLLYSMNKIANEVMDSEGGTMEEKKSLLAEARAMRAWIHFYFINLYGKPYNAQTAATDPGFPIILTNDLTRNEFERNTVAEVYDFIVSELEAAIPDLPATISNRYRISKSAGYAYLGKTLAYMHNFEDAIPALEQAIARSSHAAIPVGLYNYHVEMQAGGEYALESFGPRMGVASNYREGIHVIDQSIGSNLIFFPATYFIPKSVQDEFTASDMRRNFFTHGNFLSFTPFANGIARIYGRTSTYVLGANLPDVNLLLAEAKARQNDLSGASTLLLNFRKLRMSESDAAAFNANTKEALVREVIAERKREFVGIGDRWFTIRRLSEDPIFPGIADYKHIIYAANGAVSEEFSLPKERLTLRLPKKLLLENPGMQ